MKTGVTKTGVIKNGDKNGPRIGLFGRGRLGQAIAQAAGESLVWKVTREPPPDKPVDVAIEASAGAAVPARIEWALARRTPLVIGSTGWEIPNLREQIGDRIGVVLAPNFSLGVALLRRLTLVLARFCALDPTRDPFVVEHHHARKHDAPSGTAQLLARTILAGCPRKTSWRMGGPLEPQHLSVAAVRAGHTYSEHVIGMDAPAETIELRHAARNALAFADGALAAARFVAGRAAAGHSAAGRLGVHTMDDVAAEVLEPLFSDLRGSLR